MILRLNAGMAHAAGRHEVSMHPAVLERWPFFRYLARDDAATRVTHAALDNLVLAKTDPFWRTHTPPWDFGCRCDKEDADRGNVETHGTGRTAGAKVSNPGTGRTFEVLPDESGFEFDVEAAFSEFDMSRSRSLNLRRSTHTAMIAGAKRTDARLTLWGAGALARGQLSVRPPNNVTEIRMAFAGVYDAVANGRGLPELYLPGTGTGRTRRQLGNRPGGDGDVVGQPRDERLRGIPLEAEPRGRPGAG